MIVFILLEVYILRRRVCAILVVVWDLPKYVMRFNNAICAYYDWVVQMIAIIVIHLYSELSEIKFSSATLGYMWLWLPCATITLGQTIF